MQVMNIFVKIYNSTLKNLWSITLQENTHLVYAFA